MTKLRQIFFAYDAQAALIVGKDCEAVMNPLEHVTGLPQRLQNIVNKKYVFSVDLSDDEVRKYVVKAVLQRPSNWPAQPASVASLTQAEAQAGQFVYLAQTGTSTTATQEPASQQDILRIEAAPQTVSVNTAYVLFGDCILHN